MPEVTHPDQFDVMLRNLDTASANVQFLHAQQSAHFWDPAWHWHFGAMGLVAGIAIGMAFVYFRRR